jgi:hypothetical protein
MTPQEIFEYKLKWHKTSSSIVKVHSDLEYEAKRWCRLNLKQHQWDFSKYTNVYEDTFYFETSEFQDLFEKGLKDD